MGNSYLEFCFSCLLSASETEKGYRPCLLVCDVVRTYLQLASQHDVFSYRSLPISGALFCHSAEMRPLPHHDSVVEQ
jgi:hypothetical protein